MQSNLSLKTIYTSDSNDNLSLAFEMIEYYRKYPVIAAEIIFNKKFHWWQRIIIRTSWKYPFVLSIASKGLGKSFCAAVVCILKAMLYPNEQIGLLSSSLKQIDKTVVREIVKLYDECIHVRSSLTTPYERSSNGFTMRFKNGSFIISLAPNAKITGNRFNTLVIDEYHLVPKDILTAIVANTLLVSKTTMNPNQIGKKNSVLIFTNAYWRWNHLFETYTFYKNNRIKEPENYVVNQFDYKCAHAGYYDDSQLKKQLEEMSEDEIKMNMLSLFPANNAGWIPYTLWQGCIDEYKNTTLKSGWLEKGKQGKEYIMAVDVARSEVGDNTIIQLYEISNRYTVSESNTILKLVFSEPLKGVEYPKQADRVRSLLSDFNVIRIMMDRAKGDAVADILKTGKDINGKDCLPILQLPKYDEYMEEIPDEYTDTYGVRLIDLIDFSTSLIHQMGNSVRTYMSKKLVSLPEIEEKGDEAYLMREEVTLIVAKIGNDGYMKFEIPDELKKKKDNKTGEIQYRRDRWTTLMLGIEGIIRYVKEKNLITNIQTPESDLSSHWGWTGNR